MGTYLVSKADIKAVRDFSANVTDAKVNPYILDAQNLDIKPAIGDGLLILLLDDLDELTPTAIYDRIYNAYDYTVGTTKYRHVGLKKVACLYAYARLLEGGEFSLTQFGGVVKNSQYSDPVDKASLNRAIQSAREAAYSYLQEVKHYIESNISNYPEYDLYNRKDRTSNRITILGN